MSDCRYRQRRARGNFAYEGRWDRLLCCLCIFRRFYEYWNEWNVWADKDEKFLLMKLFFYLFFLLNSTHQWINVKLDSAIENCFQLLFWHEFSQRPTSLVNISAGNSVWVADTKKLWNIKMMSLSCSFIKQTKKWRLSLLMRAKMDLISSWKKISTQTISSYSFLFFHIIRKKWKECSANGGRNGNRAPHNISRFHQHISRTLALLSACFYCFYNASKLVLIVQSSS